MKRLKYYIITVVLIAAMPAFQKASLSWSLMNLFVSNTYNEQELKYIVELDPDKDLYFLPSLKNKAFFDAVEDLSICRNAEVRKYLYIYLTTGRQYVVKSIERSGLYLDTMEKIVRKDGEIPEDIVLLPLLESGFNPFAVSRSRAVGLWQFLASTSGILGLQSNRWVDERRDVEKSTRAAIRHLKTLHSIFKSWDLALAAYNGGAGHVKRAMLKTGTDTFWDLHGTGALRQETAEYVARYAALMVIYKNRRLFGIDDEISPFKPGDTEGLALRYPVNLRNVAAITGADIELLRKLNPELSGNLTPPYEKNYHLRLPAELKKKLEADDKKLYRLKFSSITRHTVRKGECLSSIARRYGASTRGIILLNEIGNPGYIYPGQTLYIPN